MPLSPRRFILLIIVSSGLSSYAQNSYAQKSHYQDLSPDRLLSKNSLDLWLLGNKGFFAVGYNRTLLETRHFIFQASPAIGLVPGNQEDSATSIPDFLHLNLGANIVYGMYSLNKLSLGFSYSWILTGDIYKVRPKSHYGRLLGEFAYIRHFRRDQTELKIAFSPILYDNGADDIQNIPVAVIFRLLL